MLLEPVNSSVLGSLETLLLLGVVVVTTNSETVNKLGVVVVVEGNVQGRQSLEGKLLELRGKHLIVLRRQELHRNANVGNLALLEKRRVSDGSAVNQRRVLGTQTQNSPGTVAETNGGHLLVVGLEFLCVGGDFGETDFLAVAANEGHNVEVLALLGVLQHVGLDNLAVEAVLRSHVSNMFLTQRHKLCKCASDWRRGGDLSKSRNGSPSHGQQDLLVGNVDGHIGLLCVVVGKQADIGQCPTKDVGDDEDSSILVVTSDVGWVLAESGLLADRLAVPLESFFAAARHVCDVCVWFVCGRGGGEKEAFIGGGPKELYINLYRLEGVLLACLTNLFSRVGALSSELLPHLLSSELFWPRADLAALTTGPEAA